MSVKTGVEKKCFQNYAVTFLLLYKVVVTPLSCYARCNVEHCTEGLGFPALQEARGTHIPVNSQD